MEKEQFLEALGHLAWCARCCYKYDYMKKFMAHGMKEHGWDQDYAKILALDTYTKIEDFGIVYAYQQYINDPECLDAIEHAFNIRKRKEIYDSVTN